MQSGWPIQRQGEAERRVRIESGGRLQDMGQGRPRAVSSLRGVANQRFNGSLSTGCHRLENGWQSMRTST